MQLERWFAQAASNQTMMETDKSKSIQGETLHHPQQKAKACDHVVSQHDPGSSVSQVSQAQEHAEMMITVSVKVELTLILLFCDAGTKG